MEKYIYNESNGLWYERQGNYYIPCLSLPEEEEQHVGLWGQRHLRYIREYRKALYSSLQLSGKLNGYLADIDRQAEEMFSRLVKQMAEHEGITEKLKAESQMEWVQKMNNIQNRATEIINYELIYSKQGGTSDMAYRQPTDIPKVFWKYFDLYRRKKITLNQYSENTGLSIPVIEEFLRETAEKRSKSIEKVKQL